MRFDTHRISAFLVEEFQKAKLNVLIDDGDLKHVRTVTGETAAIYLVETALPTSELRYLVETNTADHLYTMFILWAELLMPAHGTRYKPHDYMLGLLALHGEKIYAFDPYGGDQQVFPVHFEGEHGRHARYIRYGDPVVAGKLTCHSVKVTAPGVEGVWRMADFESRAGAQPANGRISLHDPLYAQLALLGVERKATPEATRLAVKRAYRKLARQYHPDLNKHADAADMMRRINQAYQAILVGL